MGIRVTVPSVKGSNSIFHKLSYYGPYVKPVMVDGKLSIVDMETGNTLATINEWIYLEQIELCEENRKQYKETENEVSITIS